MVGVPAQGQRHLLAHAAAQRRDLPAAVPAPRRAAVLQREAGEADAGAGGDRNTVRDGGRGRDPAARGGEREDLQDQLLLVLQGGDGRGLRREDAGEVRLQPHSPLPGGEEEEHAEGNGGGEAAAAAEEKTSFNVGVLSDFFSLRSASSFA